MSTADLIRRGEGIYESCLKQALEQTQRDWFVAIEPELGDYFFGSTMSAASAAARATYPDRRTYVRRVGHRVTVELGLAQP
jgi:hypothetical protein